MSTSTPSLELSVSFPSNTVSHQASNATVQSTTTTKLTTDVKVKQPDALKSFLSGGCGGVCLVLAGHPLDLIKVRLQTGAGFSTSSSSVPGGSSLSPPTSIRSAFTTILRQDGLRGLYRGMAAPLIGITPVFSVCFWGYDVGQRLAKFVRPWTSNFSSPLSSTASASFLNAPLSVKEIIFAGGFSALPTTLLMTPLERIKVILQTQESRVSKGNGMISVIFGFLRQGPTGVRQLYRGTLATLLRDVPGSMAYFGVYEVVKRTLTSVLSSSSHPSTETTSKDTNKPSGKENSLPVAAILFAGGLAGMANWIVAIPADVIKSRIQAAPSGSSHSGLYLCKELWRKEGPRAFFKGLGPALLRAFPANAACFLGVELSMKAMNTLW